MAEPTVIDRAAPAPMPSEIGLNMHLFDTSVMAGVTAAPPPDPPHINDEIDALEARLSDLCEIRDLLFDSHDDLQRKRRLVDEAIERKSQGQVAS